METPTPIIARAFAYNNCAVRVFWASYQPYFCGADIAHILEYKNPSNAVRIHVPSDDKERLIDLQVRYNHQNFQSNGANENELYIDEAGLFALIMNSKSPEKSKFKKWVLKALIPTLCKETKLQQGIREIEQRIIKNLLSFRS